MSSLSLNSNGSAWSRIVNVCLLVGNDHDSSFRSDVWMGIIVSLSSFIEFLVYKKIRSPRYLIWVCGMNIHGYEISDGEWLLEEDRLTHLILYSISCLIYCY
jgi:hypothetical protein